MVYGSLLFLLCLYLPLFSSMEVGVFNEDGMPNSPTAPASGGVEYTPLLMDYVDRGHRAD